MTKLMNETFMLLLATLLLSQLSGCMQSKATTDFENTFAVTDTPISANDNTIKMVNAVFYQAFIGGEWRYQGSIRQNNVINAYIQIPQQLNMSDDAQHNYLKQAICPSAAHQKMWNEIQGMSLAVHVYTHKRKFSTFAYCDKPVII